MYILFISIDSSVLDLIALVKAIFDNHGAIVLSYLSKRKFPFEDIDPD